MPTACVGEGQCDERVDRAEREQVVAPIDARVPGGQPGLERARIWRRRADEEVEEQPESRPVRARPRLAVDVVANEDARRSGRRWSKAASRKVKPSGSV